MVVRDARLFEAVAAEHDRVIADRSGAEEITALGTDRSAVALFRRADAAEHWCVHASAGDRVTDPRSADPIGIASAAIDEREVLAGPRHFRQQVVG